MPIVHKRSLIAAFAAAALLPAASLVQAQDLKVTIGVTAGPHAQIAEVAKQVAAKQGLKVKLVEFGDFIQPNAALSTGDIDANIRITYEDVYGNQTEQLLPLHMTVNEEAPSDMASPGDGMEAPSDQPANGGAGWIIWTLIGAVVIAGLIVLFIRLKKKRERALEDL